MDTIKLPSGGFLSASDEITIALKETKIKILDEIKIFGKVDNEFETIYKLAVLDINSPPRLKGQERIRLYPKIKKKSKEVLKGALILCDEGIESADKGNFKKALDYLGYAHQILGAVKNARVTAKTKAYNSNANVINRIDKKTALDHWIANKNQFRSKSKAAQYISTKIVLISYRQVYDWILAFEKEQKTKNNLL